jgi:hypothetical protein
LAASWSRSCAATKRAKGWLASISSRSAAGLASLMRQEVERWGKVIRKTGATAD